jgi:hypothetical protein
MGVRESRALVVMLLVFLALLPACQSSSSSGGDDDSDTGTDSDTDTDVDTDSGDDWCDGWLDQQTDLCWENPQSDQERTFAQAESYCVNLEGDWRLPLIQELISLIQGCGSNECGVTDPDCLEDECSEGSDCDSCTQNNGPADNGCYWLPELMGSCDEPIGHWSSSEDADTSNFNWIVAFSWAEIGTEPVGASRRVRCVRAE